MSKRQKVPKNHTLFSV